MFSTKLQWRSLIEKLERAKELFWVENSREHLVWIELNGVLSLNMHLDRAGHGTLLLQRSSASAKLASHKLSTFSQPLLV
jgi:hypothetical protein